MAGATNPYCKSLGIAVPSLAAVRERREASTYALLIVTLLHHGRPMRLDEVARELEAAGIVADEDDAYAALKRCRPARPPVYRDGELYGLDPYDAELDLWVFRLGLRPPKVAPPAPVPPPPRPPTQQPVSVAELDEAWRGDASLTGWSAQRIVLAILDAHDRPMPPSDVVAFVASRTRWHRLTADTVAFQRKNSAVALAADGAWTIVPGARELVMAREAVRDAIERRRQRRTFSPVEFEANKRAAEQRSAAHAAELAALRRVIVHAFPVPAPRAVVLVDVDTRELTTLTGDQLADAGRLLARHDVLSGVDIRATLRALAIDPTDRRLAELGPPQKSIQLTTTARTLKITTSLLIHGSCGIRRPFGDPKQLRAYLARDQLTKLRARLEADARALYALHEYGRLHGCVRLRWGQLDEVFPAPWHHWDEPTLHALMRQAHELDVGIEAVIGAAPDWVEPWSRACRLVVQRGEHAWDLMLFDEYGRYINDRDVQLARLEVAVH